MSADFDFYYQDILVATGGARLVTLKTAAQLLGRPVEYIYNSVWKNKFEIPIKKIGHNSFVTAADLAQFLSGSTPPTGNRNDVPLREVSSEIDALKTFIGTKKTGRPKKREVSTRGTR
jgi:hypothetical protein